MNKYNLPKGYLSYSAYALWKRDKEAYRRRYYENEPSFETRETIFGKRIAKMLEENHKDFDHVPRLDTPEYAIDVELDGLKLKGYLDTFDSKTFGFGEYKTGHADKYGKDPWDAVKVRKHEQLVFYSLLIKLKHGKVKNKTWLAWLETILQGKSISFAGHTLESDSQEVILTGRIQIFERVIFEWERKKLIKEIKKIATEITDDYENYLKVHEPLSKEVAQEIAAK